MTMMMMMKIKNLKHDLIVVVVEGTSTAVLEEEVGEADTNTAPAVARLRVEAPELAEEPEVPLAWVRCTAKERRHLVSEP